MRYSMLLVAVKLNGCLLAYVTNGAVAIAILKRCIKVRGVIDVVKLAFVVAPLVASHRAVGLSALGVS